MKRYLVNYLPLFLTAILLFSCEGGDVIFSPPATRQPVTCSDILSPELNEFPFSQLTHEETIHWIQETFGVNPKEDSTHDTSIQYLSWEQAGKKYRATFVASKNASGVAMDWVNRPTVAELLDCIGEPSYYAAWLDFTQGGDYLAVELWYPESGYQVRAYGRNSPVSAIEDSMPVIHMFYYTPGSISEAVGRAFSEEIGMDFYNTHIAQMKLWPGNLDQLVIDDR